MEKWDAYDAMGDRLPHTLVRGEKVPLGEYHLVVHIWYRNAAGQILIQRRALSRELAPGLWAATGGSALAGESIREALLRESQEEMGICPDVSSCAHVLTYTTPDSHTAVYLVPYNGTVEELVLQEEEVMDARFVTVAELSAMIGDKHHFWQYRYLPLLVQYLREHPVDGACAACAPI